MARYDTGSTQTARWGWSVLGFQSVQALADVATAAIVDDLDTSKS